MSENGQEANVAYLELLNHQRGLIHWGCVHPVDSKSMVFFPERSPSTPALSKRLPINSAAKTKIEAQLPKCGERRLLIRSEIEKRGGRLRVFHNGNSVGRSRAR